MPPLPLWQVEAIALDPDAENGIASIGSMDANNLGSSQMQATQGASQVRFVSILAVAGRVLQAYLGFNASTPALGAHQQC